MKLLAIDTTATAASACLAEDGRIIGEFYVNTALTHSRTLVPMIEQLMLNTGEELDKLSVVAVNAGPGSFTGVRIGVAAVKGIAFASDIPCMSVSTLESMAYNVSDSDAVVCAVMDARCSQVYNALFRTENGTVSRLCVDRALSVEDLRRELEGMTEKVILVGDGAALCYEAYKDSLKNVSLAQPNNRFQRASSVAMAAFDKLSKGETVSAEELMPVYLRLPQAQRELNSRRLNNNS